MSHTFPTNLCTMLFFAPILCPLKDQCRPDLPQAIQVWQNASQCLPSQSLLEQLLGPTNTISIWIISSFFKSSERYPLVSFSMETSITRKKYSQQISIISHFESQFWKKGAGQSGCKMLLIRQNCRGTHIIYKSWIENFFLDPWWLSMFFD